MSKQIQLEIKRLKPIQKTSIENIPLPPVHSEWLDHDIRPTHSQSGIRTTVGVSIHHARLRAGRYLLELLFLR